MLCWTLCWELKHWMTLRRRECVHVRMRVRVSVRVSV